MHRLITLALCVCLFFLAHLAHAQSDKSRYEKLKQESRTSAFNIIELTQETLRSQIINKHNYSLIVYFSLFGADAAQGCPHCGAVNQDYKDFVSEFNKQLSSKGGYSSAAFTDHPVFFAQCDFRNCRDLLVSLGWRSLPQLVHLAPRDEKVSESEAVEILRRQSLMTSLYDDSSPPKIADWVRERTGYSVFIDPPLIRTVGPYVLVVVALYAVIRLGGHRIKQEAKKPLFWFVISMGVFAFSMAGVVFNAIHSPSFAYRHPQNGQLFVIYPSARQQFVAEGLLMAAILTALVATLVAIGDYVPKIRDPLKQKVSFGILCCLFFFFYQSLLTIFKVKYGWYPLA